MTTEDTLFRLFTAHATGYLYPNYPHAWVAGRSSNKGPEDGIPRRLGNTLIRQGLVERHTDQYGLDTYRAIMPNLLHALPHDRVLKALDDIVTVAEMHLSDTYAPESQFLAPMRHNDTTSRLRRHEEALTYHQRAVQLRAETLESLS